MYITGRRKLRTSSGSETRPVSRKVREAVFQILGPVEGSRVLDIFAGTGSLGIQALLSGASFTVFVDKSPKASHIIRENLIRIFREDWRQYGRVLTCSWERALKNLTAQEEKFGIVFCDPPYKTGLAFPTAEQTLVRGLIEPGGIIVLFMDKRASAPDRFEVPIETQDHIENAINIFKRNYGDTKVCLYQAVKRE